jgi:uncharacterized protein with HEPN domain
MKFLPVKNIPNRNGENFIDNHWKAISTVRDRTIHQRLSDGCCA